MRTQSCKAKGRRACQEVKDILLKYAPDLKEDDIEVTSSGATGEDVKLSPAARMKYPFVIEVKNQEALNIWKAYEQSVSHLENKKLDNNLHFPIVFFRRNRSKLLVCIDAEHFIKLVS